MKTNADMTVYNRRVVDKQETYIPTTIYGVSWNQKYKTTLTEKGLVGAQEFSVRIPATAVAGTPGASKAYIPHEQYDGADPEKFFTFRPDDWIVRGIVSGEMSEATTNNPNACEVRCAVDNRDTRASAGMLHWRVMG